MNIPDCPNCDLQPVDFNDKVGMWVIVCECCGLMEQFEIIAGSRRFRAAKLANLLAMPAVLRELSEV